MKVIEKCRRYPLIALGQTSASAKLGLTVKVLWLAKYLTAKQDWLNRQALTIGRTVIMCLVQMRFWKREQSTKYFQSPKFVSIFS
jgi:hypothetical protein